MEAQRRKRRPGGYGLRRGFPGPPDGGTTSRTIPAITRAPPPMAAPGLAGNDPRASGAGELWGRLEAPTDAAGEAGAADVPGDETVEGAVAAVVAGGAGVTTAGGTAAGWATGRGASFVQAGAWVTDVTDAPGVVVVGCGVRVVGLGAGVGLGLADSLGVPLGIGVGVRGGSVGCGLAVVGDALGLALGESLGVGVGVAVGVAPVGDGEGEPDAVVLGVPPGVAEGHHHGPPWPVSHRGLTAFAGVAPRVGVANAKPGARTSSPMDAARAPATRVVARVPVGGSASGTRCFPLVGGRLSVAGDRGEKTSLERVTEGPLKWIRDASRRP